jgi:two-component system copper resistance phosphate regulon response regulator CusR
MVTLDERDRTRAVEILVVDTDVALAADVAAVLPTPVHVTAVTDGYQALHELAASSFDAVVLELFLPGVDGCEVIRRLNAAGAQPPVIVVTHAHDVRLRDLDVHSLLTKPVERATLARALATALSAPAALSGHSVPS